MTVQEMRAWLLRHGVSEFDVDVYLVYYYGRSEEDMTELYRANKL